MDSLRRVPTRRRLARNQSNFFGPKIFLANVGAGRTVRQYRPKQAIFSQGDRADAVFYIQEGKVRLSVLSKQGKEATVALLGTADFVGEGCIASDQTLHLATATAITEVLYPEDRKEPDGAHAPR